MLYSSPLFLNHIVRAKNVHFSSLSQMQAFPFQLCHVVLLTPLPKMSVSLWFLCHFPLWSFFPPLHSLFVIFVRSSSASIFLSMFCCLDNSASATIETANPSKCFSGQEMAIPENTWHFLHPLILSQQRKTLVEYSESSSAMTIKTPPMERAVAQMKWHSPKCNTAEDYKIWYRDVLDNFIWVSYRNTKLNM